MALISWRWRRTRCGRRRLKLVSYVPQGAMNALNPVLRIREQILDGVADHGVALSRGERSALVESCAVERRSAGSRWLISSRTSYRAA